MELPILVNGTRELSNTSPEWLLLRNETLRFLNSTNSAVTLWWKGYIPVLINSPVQSPINDTWLRMNIT